MAADERSAPLTAVGRLEAALIDQARLGDAYARSVSTSAEQSCYLRLQAASLEVSRCDRAVKSGTVGDE
jgi:hypothetical protein